MVALHPLEVTMAWQLEALYSYQHGCYALWIPQEVLFTTADRCRLTPLYPSSCASLSGCRLH